MKKLKVATIIGTRPEIIRLSETIKLLDSFYDHVLIHTGQNYSKNLKDVFFDDLNLRQPDYYLNVSNENLGKSIGEIIEKSYSLLKEIQPDAFLILGDTNSCLSSISAKRLKIPIFHIEAGNRCYDLNLPEEINRKIIDEISDVNITYSNVAKNNLLFSKTNKEFIFCFGSPMKEIYLANKEKILKSNILEKLKIIKNQYILLSIHREENIDNDNNFNLIVNSIYEISKHFNMNIVFSVHPRTSKKIEQKKIKFNNKIILIDSLGYLDFCWLQINSFCVMSDSGSLSEEASIMNFPSVLVRTSTERQEAIEFGSITIGNILSNDIINSVIIETKLFEKSKKLIPIEYEWNNFSFKVIKVIQSYTPIINKNVWKK